MAREASLQRVVDRFDDRVLESDGAPHHFQGSRQVSEADAPLVGLGKGLLASLLVELENAHPVLLREH